MNYVKLNEQGAIERYPYTLTDLRRDNPNTSFPRELEASSLEGFNLYPVAGEPPSFDATVGELVEQDPALVDGQWQRQWSIVPLSAEEIQQRLRANADYNTFWLALLQTNAFASIRSQATQSLAMNTAATEFIALLGDAKMGRPLEPAIQQAITAVLTVGTFTEADLLEFQAALVAGSLEQIYSLGVP